MNNYATDPRADKDLTDQEKNVLPEPERPEDNHAAEATEFIDEEIRMTEQPFDNN